MHRLELKYRGSSVTSCPSQTGCSNAWSGLCSSSSARMRPLFSPQNSSISQRSPLQLTVYLSFSIIGPSQSLSISSACSSGILYSYSSRVIFFVGPLTVKPFYQQGTHERFFLYHGSAIPGKSGCLCWASMRCLLQETCVQFQQA